MVGRFYPETLPHLRANENMDDPYQADDDHTGSRECGQCRIRRQPARAVGSSLPNELALCGIRAVPITPRCVQLDYF